MKIPTNKEVLLKATLMSIFLLFFFAIGIVSLTDKILNKPDLKTEEKCEATEFLDFGISNLDIEHLDYKVNNFFIREKQISKFYYEKLCDDLVLSELKETLQQSDNIYLEIEWVSFDEKNIMLFCDYSLKWIGNDDFKGMTISYNRSYFDTEEFLLAQENRPSKFNLSLINISWVSELQQSEIRNGNADYSVLLGLRLNETIEQCYYE